MAMHKSNNFRLNRNKTEATNKLTWRVAKWNRNLLGIEQLQNKSGT